MPFFLPMATGRLSHTKFRAVGARVRRIRGIRGIRRISTGARRCSNASGIAAWRAWESPAPIFRGARANLDDLPNRSSLQGFLMICIYIYTHTVTHPPPKIRILPLASKEHWKYIYIYIWVYLFFWYPLEWWFCCFLGTGTHKQKAPSNGRGCFFFGRSPCTHHAADKFSDAVQTGLDVSDPPGWAALWSPQAGVVQAEGCNPQDFQGTVRNPITNPKDSLSSQLRRLKITFCV